jgi:hypothetical protein
VTDDLVAIETVGTGFEADAVCGLLREAGIECMHRGTATSAAVLGGVGEGPREVVVRGEDADRARAVLAARPEG